MTSPNMLIQPDEPEDLRPRIDERFSAAARSCGAIATAGFSDNEPKSGTPNMLIQPGEPEDLRPRIK